MKVIYFAQYGAPDVLQVKEIEKPVPKDHEILIRVKATAVNSADWRLRKADPFAVRFFLGLQKPKINILGGVFSGEVEAVGKDVTLYKAGDAVFGSAAMTFGAYAEYLCLKEKAPMAYKPINVTHAQAAVVSFGGMTALHFLQKASIKQGNKVLVYGASGAVGTAAIQLAVYFGAQVTAVCSAANADLVRSLGAVEVIDYTKEDFTTNGKIYDVIFETVNKISVARSLKSLHKDGTLILGAAGISEMLQAFWSFKTGSRKILYGMATETAAHMQFLKGLVEDGKFKAVIDKTFLLEQMAEAHTYVEKGHKKGNVAIVLN